MSIPTTKEIADQNIANFEAKLGQTVPLNEKAFLRVLAVNEAVLFTSLYKFSLDRLKQNLISTANGDGLDILGNEYGIVRKVAVAAGLQITVPGTAGTVIPATVDFIGDSNGIRYSVDASATVAVSGLATVDITARETGDTGNLSIGDTLTIGTQVAGVTTTGTVTVVTTTGTDREGDDDYRVRIFDVVRAPGGGGNAADYRNWAQEVSGVKRAFPYAGLPTSISGISSPPDRTVYVESTTDVDADGIPPSSTLSDVRDALTTDPVTGLSRQPLGLTDDTLYVEAITRTGFYVQITGLTVDSSVLATVRSNIETQLETYFLSIDPFVDGVDAVNSRDDIITDLSVSNIVQDVIAAYGGSASSVSFDTISGGSLAEYQMNQGEKAKLLGITYV